MAINTENRRRSALNTLPTACVLPATDASIDAGDRAQLCWVYRAFFEPVVAAATRRMSALRVMLNRR